MSVRVALLAALIFAAGPSLATPTFGADRNTQDRVVSEDAKLQAPASRITVFVPGTPGDIVGIDGPSSNLPVLRKIAVAASIGNRDAVEIFSASARQFGVNSRADPGRDLRYAVAHLAARCH